MSERTARKPKTRPAPAPLLQLSPTLLKAIRVVVAAASPDEARGVITGVHIVAGRDDASVMLEATDSYRIYRCTLDDCQRNGEPLDVIVPAAWLKAVEILCRRTGRWWKSPPRLTFNNGRAHLWTQVEERSIPIIDGDYPNVEKLIGEARERAHNPDQVVGFNPKFYIDLLKAVVVLSPHAAARMTVPDGGLRASRIEAFESDIHFVGLLMPLRLIDRAG